MAYNPYSYSPNYGGYQYNQVPTIQPPQQNSSIIWVQGEAGAKSFLVSPNSTVALWDSENQIIYLKSADASGMPSIKVLDYTMRGSENNQNKSVLSEPEKKPAVDYATKTDLDDIRSQIAELKNPKYDYDFINDISDMKKRIEELESASQKRFERRPRRDEPVVRYDKR